MLLAATGSGLYGFSSEGQAALQVLHGKAVTAVAATPERVYAAVRGAGVLESAEGAQWDVALDGVNARCLGVAPDGGVYAGTDPAAVYRSYGEGFELLDSIRELPSYPLWTFPNPPHVGNIRCVTFSDDTVYAAVEVGGVIGSRDGGKTWSEMREGLHPDVHWVTCATDGTLYAATGQGFFRSRESGASWESCCDGLQTIYLTPLAVSSERPEVVFTSGTEGRPRYWRGRDGGARGTIYRSTKAGDAWEPVMGGLDGAVEVLAIDPADPETVYAGTADGKILKGVDLGNSWTVLADGLPPVHKIAFTAVP